MIRPVLSQVRLSSPEKKGKGGELSAAWNNFLQKYLLVFFDFGARPCGFYLRTADEPWRSWSSGRMSFDGSEKHDWYQTGWGGPCGGYLLRDLTRDGGRTVYVTLSLWTPYYIFLMEMDLGQLFSKVKTRPR
jgi:hypothetical protein